MIITSEETTVSIEKHGILLISSDRAVDREIEGDRRRTNHSADRQLLEGVRHLMN